MFDASELEAIISEYKAGASLAQLGRDYHCASQTIRKELVSQGISIRSRNEQNKYSPQNQRIYQINDNYFSLIDNPDKAYLLGFLAADGGVYKNELKIGLSLVDRDFLESIRDVWETTYPIKDYETKDGYRVSELVIRSSQLLSDLAKYNIVERKTYNFSFPYNIPEEYYIDFIRGYWDGDGTICLAGGYARASLCSYRKEVLQSILDILEQKYQIPPVAIRLKKGSNTYYFQYSQRSAEKLYHAFYDNIDNLTIGLTRKYEKFKSLFGEINSHEPATSEMEEKIV